MRTRHLVPNPKLKNEIPSILRIPPSRYGAFLQLCFSAGNQQWDFSLQVGAAILFWCSPAPQTPCRRHAREEEQSRSPEHPIHPCTKTWLSLGRALQWQCGSVGPASTSVAEPFGSQNGKLTTSVWPEMQLAAVWEALGKKIGTGTVCNPFQS